MMDYELVSWQSEYFDKNLDSLQAHLRALDCGDLAQHAETAARQPGPLNVFLARCYWQFNATHVAARLLSWARRRLPGATLGDVIALVSPALRWDHGMEPIEWALREVQVMRGELGDPTSSHIPEVIEAMWLLGLCRLTFQPDGPGVYPLTGFVKGDSRVSAQSVRRSAGRRLREVWAQTVGCSTVCPAFPEDRLWQNAVVMLKLKRHEWLEKGRPDAFRRLLIHVLSGGTWGPPSGANDEVRRKAETSELSGYWQQQGTMQLDDPYVLEVGFLDDPVEILNIGNAFDTCLRVGGDNEAEIRGEDRAEARILGYATNANIRVVVARGSNGRIHGRRTLGLSLEARGGLVQSPTYPKGHVHVQTAIDCFVKTFVADAGLRWSDSRVVSETCAPFYDEFQVGCR